MSSTAMSVEARLVAKPANWYRRVLSFPFVLCCLLAVLSFLTTKGRFDDPDMWWHLKTGEVIWTTHSIPAVDTFSYTTHHFRSVPHEWLAQLTIYGAYRFGGFPGLMGWLFLLSALILVSGYTFCALYSGNAKVAFGGALLIWLFSTIGLSVRPQMLGYLLLILELIIIHCGRTRNIRWFLWLPLLFAVWINVHGSFFLGLIVATVFLITSYFHFQTGLLEAMEWDKSARQLLLISLALSAAALFVNPTGWRQVAYPVETMLSLPLNTNFVLEWQPLQLTTQRGIALMIVTGGIFLSVMMKPTQLFLDELLLLILGVWLATEHERMLFVFGILTASTVTRLYSSAWDKYDPEGDHPWINLSLIASSALLVILAFPSNRNLNRQVEINSPVAAVDFIRDHHLTGPMLNEWVYGGYLIWALPELPVFVDGRGDVFEWSGMLAPFREWSELQSDPNDLLDQYHIHFCLLGRASPMAKVMGLLNGWKQVYSDDQSIIFQKM